MPGMPGWGRAFLDQRRHATLATVEPDGAPHVVPVWFVFRDDHLFVATNSGTRKFKNVAARPTASLVVDIRDPGKERWVSGTGPVAILRGDDAGSIVTAIHERYLTPEAITDPRTGPGFAAVDDVVLRIEPRHWRSWAAADVDEQFFGGVLSASPERWFRKLD
jgi:PPOX class probable F420-dependent enzyme